MSLQLEYSALANCQPEHIWNVFQQIELWPRWDPEAIRSVQWVSGQPWTPGSRFEIKIAKPLTYTITPEILEIEAPIFLHWRGKGSGVTGEQYFIFKGQADGTTEMRTLQEFSGMPIKLMGNKVRQPILDGIAHMFRQIRSEAEQRARAQQDREVTAQQQSVPVEVQAPPPEQPAQVATDPEPPNSQAAQSDQEKAEQQAPSGTSQPDVQPQEPGTGDS